MLVATGLARRIGVSEDVASDVYYAALLEHVGCNAFAHETAALVGDDIASNRAGSRTNFADPRGVFATYLPELLEGVPLRDRVRLIGVVLARGNRMGEATLRSGCEVAAATARRLGLSAGLERSLHEAFEWWNGKGAPKGLKGDDIALPSRIVNVATHGVRFAALGGPELALEAVRRRSGGYLDPELAAAFVRDGSGLLDEAWAGDASAAVLETEPAPRRLVSDGELDQVARAFGDVADLKSPYLHGHASRVAELAEEAGRRLGLDEAQAVALRRAGFLHDVGRASVSNSIWDKPGPLTAAEWERVRLHAYHSERVVSRSGALAPLAPIVGAHHERQDGSGYHRGLQGHAIPFAGRILAAADVYVALTQARPHRTRLEPSAAAEELRAEARRSRLDANVVACVLGAAGHAERRRRPWPAEPAGRFRRRTQSAEGSTQ